MNPDFYGNWTTTFNKCNIFTGSKSSIVKRLPALFTLLAQEKHGWVLRQRTSSWRWRCRLAPPSSTGRPAACAWGSWWSCRCRGGGSPADSRLGPRCKRPRESAGRPRNRSGRWSSRPGRFPPEWPAMVGGGAHEGQRSKLAWALMLNVFRENGAKFLFSQLPNFFFTFPAFYTIDTENIKFEWSCLQQFHFFILYFVFYHRRVVFRSLFLPDMFRRISFAFFRRGATCLLTGLSATSVSPSCDTVKKEAKEIWPNMSGKNSDLNNTRLW